MLQKFHSNEFPAPCVSIASTSLELLTWIKETIKKGTIISKKNYKALTPRNGRYSLDMFGTKEILTHTFSRQA